MSNGRPLLLLLILVCGIVPPAAAAEPETQAPVKVDEQWIIGPDDILTINVWKDANLNCTVPVRPDGKISFPLIGDIVASGKTCLQLKDEISEKLSRYYQDPNVTVSLSEVNSYKVYVQGAITNPGMFVLKEKTTVAQLVALAGGPSEEQYPDLKHAFIIRGQKTVPVNLKALLKKRDLSQNIVLEPGDILVVPGE